MGGLFIPWLADAARLTGYPVVENAGWRTRGVPGSNGQPLPMRVCEGVVLHHTADGPTGDYPSLRVVRDGRSDLQGPLAHYGLARSGAIQVIASGLCYHAGASSWAGFSDLNDEFIGIEAEATGTTSDCWTDEQLDAYPRLVAAILYYLHRDASRAGGHKEVCLPRGRKIDPAFIDLNAFRAQVAHLLGDPLGRIPRFANSPALQAPPKEAEMLENIPVTGSGGFRYIIPIGAASAVLSRAWVSLVTNGPAPASAHVFFQNDAGGIADRQLDSTFRDGWSSRPWLECPDGTTQIVVQYVAPNGAVVALEGQPK